MLSTDNQIVKGKAQNWKKKEREGRKEEKFAIFQSEKSSFKEINPTLGFISKNMWKNGTSINMNNMS